jgi:predicted transcriptional regulator
LLIGLFLLQPGLLFKSLQESVVLFLKHSEQRMRPNKAGRRVLTCKVGEKLYDVMNRLVTHQIHRLWVVNDRDVAIGVVSFADIFSHLHGQQQEHKQ